MSKVLVLGGTNFIGRNFIEHPKAQAWELTLFNRGKTNPSYAPAIPRITGDRGTESVAQLKEYAWDMVVDFSGYYPAHIQNVLDNLVQKPRLYVFISTCSVYDNDRDQSKLRQEDNVIYPCSEEQKTDTTWDSYGQRKAECERVLQAAGIPLLVLRPALVVGPYDNTDRLYYWLHQVQHFDPIMVPRPGGSHLSTVFVQDLVRTVFAAMEADTPITGTYNITSHPWNSVADVVAETMRQCQKNPRRVVAPPAWLHEQEVAEWEELPLWLDTTMYTYANDRWLATFGLDPTPLHEAIAQTMAYYADLGWPTPIYGIDRARQEQLLARLNA